MRFRRYGWLLFALIAYGILAICLPLADDELYYWCWAQNLQLSYYDHPPMVAYWIRSTTAVFGQSVFALRLPACLATVGVLAAVTYLSRSRTLMPLIVCTLPYTLGAALITPDSPLLLFWAAYVVWLVEVHRRLTPTGWDESVGWDESASPTNSAFGSRRSAFGTEIPRTPKPERRNPNPVGLADSSHPTTTTTTTVAWWLWLTGGAILGAGVLGKYTMALAVPAGFVSFSFVLRAWRRWLPGYVLHGLVAFAVASPILIYNAEREFAPLLFQWRHTLDAPASAWQSLAEFIGVQLLLCGTIPFVLLPWVIGRTRTFAANPRLRVCSCLYALPIIFFLYKATQSKLEGNWALASYIAFWPLGEAWYERVKSARLWRIATFAGFLIPQVAVVGLAVHLIVPLGVIPIAGDRLTLQYEKNALMHQIAADLRAQLNTLPVYARTYQVTAQLQFCGIDARQIEGASRPSHFTQTPQRLTDSERALVVTDRPLAPQFAAGFGEPESMGRYPLVVRGKVVQTYEVWRYQKNSSLAAAAACRHPQTQPPETPVQQWAVARP